MLVFGLLVGMLYFVVWDIFCEMCEDILCVKVCLSGVLDCEIELIDDVWMGLVVLVDQENCFNFQGLCCDVCYCECLKIDEVIILELECNMCIGKYVCFLLMVYSDVCIGCGKCEKVCVLE